MLTLTQITAIISLLIAFQVPQSTVDQVSLILYQTQDPAATSTPLTPSAPVYFGSTAPQSDQTQTPDNPQLAPADSSTPVVQSKPMPVDTTPFLASNIDIITTSHQGNPVADGGTELPAGTYLRVFVNKPITSTTVNVGRLGDVINWRAGIL